MNIYTNPGVALIVGNFLALFWLLALMYILCQFGQQLTDEFVAFEQTIYESYWYLFTMDVQRLFIIVTMLSQKPVELKGFGNIHCTLETFKNVIVILKKNLHFFEILKKL